MGVSIWEGSKAQALIDAVTGAQKVDKQQGVINAGKALVVGEDGIVGFGFVSLSSDAKQALLNCFRHVAWIDEYGSTYISALEDALDQSIAHEWDYEWYAKSLTLPENAGVVSFGSYEFTTNPYALHGIGYYHDLQLARDNIQIEIECKFDLNSSHSSAQLILKTGEKSGFKVFRETTNYIVTNISGSITSLTDIDASEYHTYMLKSNNGSCELYIDGTLLASGSGVTNSDYLYNTGIGVGDNAELDIRVKSVKYKLLS